MTSQPTSRITHEPTTASLSRDFRRWAKRVGLSNKITVTILTLAILSGVATYIALTVSASPFSKNPKTIYWLLNLNMVILIVLSGMIIRRVVTLWIGSRRGLAGAKLHVQLVRAFSFIAIVPGVVMAIFAAIFFSSVVDQWFGDKVRIAINESLAVAQAYLQEHQQNIRADALSMAVDLNREAPQTMNDPTRMSELLRTQSLIRNLTESLVFTHRGQILGRSGLTFSMEFENLPFDAMRQADTGEVALQINETGDRVRALIKLDNYPDAYLYVGRLVEEKVLDHIQTAQKAYADYTELQGRRSQVQLIFAATFVVVALLLTLVAVWIGLWFANRLVEPISRLIVAAERVRAGDLSFRIQNINPIDEMATLQRAFNRMTNQLETQHADLMKANTMLDQRRHFTETVLSGVSAGVMAVNELGVITVTNQALQELLGNDLTEKSLYNVSPEIEELRQKLLNSDQKLVQIELQWGVQNEMIAASKTFLVRVSRDSALSMKQVIVTLDDITLLQSAQRIAAWSDVARRIAHEIKNPLTPIQLSAERLKKRYLKQIEDDPATFESCIDTIIRQVGDIETMVTEFSSFARMKEPEKQKEDLGELCRQAVTLQQQARTDIRFLLALPETAVWIAADRQQINQVLINVLQNSIDAIDGRNEKTQTGVISINIQPRNDKCFLIFEDNGKGFPENKERLMEPYVTTRSQGTGLGLSIVKKILDDHAAVLTLSDRTDSIGARIEIALPIWHSRSIHKHDGIVLIDEK